MRSNKVFTCPWSIKALKPVEISSWSIQKIIHSELYQTINCSITQTPHSPPTCYGLGSVFRFHRIRRWRISTGLHSTKPTATCASIPEKHDCRSCNPISTSIPALCTHTLQSKTQQTTTRASKKEKQWRELKLTSPMLGHCASSQTVLSFNWERDSLISRNLSPCGAFCRNHSGFFTFGSRPVCGPSPPGPTTFFSTDTDEASHRIVPQLGGAKRWRLWAVGDGVEKETEGVL